MQSEYQLYLSNKKTTDHDTLLYAAPPRLVNKASQISCSNSVKNLGTIRSFLHSVHSMFTIQTITDGEVEQEDNIHQEDIVKFFNTKGEDNCYIISQS